MTKKPDYYSIYFSENRRTLSVFISSLEIPSLASCLRSLLLVPMLSKTYQTFQDNIYHQTLLRKGKDH